MYLTKKKNYRHSNNELTVSVILVASFMVMSCSSGGTGENSSAGQEVNVIVSTVSDVNNDNASRPTAMDGSDVNMDSDITANPDAATEAESLTEGGDDSTTTGQENTVSDDTAVSDTAIDVMESDDNAIDETPELPVAATAISVNPTTGDIGNGGGEFPLRESYGLALSDDGQYAFYARAEDSHFIAAGESTTVYRYRISDGHVDQVIENRNRTRQNVIGISFNGEYVIYNFDSETYLAEARNEFAANTLGELVGEENRIYRPRFSRDGTSLFFESSSFSFEENRQSIDYYDYDLESGTVEKILSTSLPHPTNLHQDWIWTPRTLIDVSKNGNVLLLAADVQPVEQSDEILEEDTGHTAYMVYNRAENMTYAIAVYKNNPYSTPADAGFFTPMPAPLLSAAGDVVVFAALPEADEPDTRRSSLLYRFNYLTDTAPVEIEAASSLSHLSIDDSANIIAWRKSVEHSVYNFATKELTSLTSNGYTPCGRACARGNNDYLGPRVAADGSRVVFAEHVRSDSIEDWADDSSMLKSFEVSSGAFSTVLNPIDDRSTKPLSIFDFDISADGNTVVTESAFHTDTQELPHNVVLLNN